MLTFVKIIRTSVCSLLIASYALSSGPPAEQQLRNALYYNNPELMIEAIEAGANVNGFIRRRSQTTPLHKAAKEGQRRNTAILLREGANANAATTMGITPLMLAAEGKSLTVVRELIKAGAHLNAEDKRGRSVLQYAAQSRHTKKREIVPELMKRGAFPKIEGLLPREKNLITQNKHLYDAYISATHQGIKALEVKDLERLLGEFAGVEKLPEQAKKLKSKYQ